MSQLHVRAQAGEVAPITLLPGDPNRATLIAETFFEEPRLYNSYRQLLGYTGSYKGKRVSVQATGMGCPSLAIVVEELVRLGAHTLVRVGTCGAVGSGVAPGDMVVASAAVAGDGTTRQYLNGANYSPTADFDVTRALADRARQGARRCHVGLIQTDDAFYATEAAHVAGLAARGILAVEMEASALFTLGALRRVRTGCILVVGNNIGDPTFLAAELLQRAVLDMVESALDALVELS